MFKINMELTHVPLRVGVGEIIKSLRMTNLI